MDIGFVTFYNKETVEFAAKAGFDCLEVFTGEEYGFKLDDGKINETLEVFKTNGMKFGTIVSAPNHLAGDPVKRKENNREFIHAIKLCRRLGTDIVMSNAWADPAKSPAENMTAYREVFGEYARAAEAEGVRIALENCPHALGYPMHIGNISFSPEMWDAMFDAVPSKAIGLEFDPSHLCWQGIDYIKALRKYGDRVYAFHAKDTEIIKDELDRCGIFGKQLGKASEWDAGWWRYRLPGWGSIDWKEIFKALNDISYNGPIMIEHEDPVFDGDRREEGLKMGLRFLRQFML